MADLSFFLLLDEPVEKTIVYESFVESCVTWKIVEKIEIEILDLELLQ